LLRAAGLLALGAWAALAATLHWIPDHGGTPSQEKLGMVGFGLAAALWLATTVMLVMVLSARHGIVEADDQTLWLGKREVPRSAIEAVERAWQGGSAFELRVPSQPTAAPIGVGTRDRRVRFSNRVTEGHLDRVDVILEGFDYADVYRVLTREAELNGFPYTAVDLQRRGGAGIFGGFVRYFAIVAIVGAMGALLAVLGPSPNARVWVIPLPMALMSFAMATLANARPLRPVARRRLEVDATEVRVVDPRAQRILLRGPRTAVTFGRCRFREGYQGVSTWMAAVVLSFPDFPSDAFAVASPYRAPWPDSEDPCRRPAWTTAHPDGWDDLVALFQVATTAPIVDFGLSRRAQSRSQ
jgi:hypothetical protein